ncbi:DoxX family protein [Eionea flava]
MYFLDKYQEYTLFVFRIIMGFLFLFHGTQKLFGFPLPFPYELSPMTSAAGVIELTAGVLVMIGFYSRISAFIASGTMAAAYWIAHGLNNPLPIMNGGELAVLYCFGFLLIATHGPGIFSLNKR